MRVLLLILGLVTGLLCHPSRAQQSSIDRGLSDQATACFRAVLINPEFTHLRSKSPTIFSELAEDIHLSDRTKASSEEIRLLRAWQERVLPCRALTLKAIQNSPSMADSYRRHGLAMDEVYAALVARTITWGEANTRFVQLVTVIMRQTRGVGSDDTSATTPGQETRGNGSGFFVTNDGYVVTNAHVVRRHLLYRAVVRGRELVLRVIDVDETNDLALAKVEAQAIPIPLAATLPAKGEDVAALGFPAAETLGRELKATFGKINALSGPRGDVRFLQIDAAIQPGNSGGPLLNLRGEAIGIVTASFTTAANVRRLGGAIPQNVNYAVKIGYLTTLLDRNIPGKWRRGGTRFASTTDLIRMREASVVLILVR